MLAARGAGAALVQSRTLPAPDAILILASHEWERLPVAADAARQALGSRVILSLPRVITPHNCHLCDQRVGWLQALGIDAARVVELPRRVGNTRDEAVAALEFCRRQGVRQLLVVTSPYHTRRALATFDDVFLGSGVQIGVQPASAHSIAQPDRWWRAPYDRWYVRYEWTAIGWYLVRYGIIPSP